MQIGEDRASCPVPIVPASSTRSNPLTFDGQYCTNAIHDVRWSGFTNHDSLCYDLEKPTHCFWLFNNPNKGRFRLSSIKEPRAGRVVTPTKRPCMEHHRPVAISGSHGSSPGLLVAQYTEVAWRSYADPWFDTNMLTSKRGFTQKSKCQMILSQWKWAQANLFHKRKLMVMLDHHNDHIQHSNVMKCPTDSRIQILLPRDVVCIFRSGMTREHSGEGCRDCFWGLKEKNDTSKSVHQPSGHTRNARSQRSHSMHAEPSFHILSNRSRAT